MDPRILFQVGVTVRSVPTSMFYVSLQCLLSYVTGFRKCGLYPLNPEESKNRLPHHRTVDDDRETASIIVSKQVENMLETMRAGPQVIKTRHTMVNVAPGCSIAEEDLKTSRFQCTIHHSLFSCRNLIALLREFDSQYLLISITYRYFFSIVLFQTWM